MTGRFAPSPSGPLHLGSLLVAVGSYVQARSQGASWYLRIDDLDEARVVPGVADEIMRTLDRYALGWDGAVMYQSERRAAYAAAVDRLKDEGHAFDCGCTRKEARGGPAGIEGPIYPGTCRNGLPSGRKPRSVRLRVSEERVTVMDPVQGAYTQALGRDVGDFVIQRADGVTAYQLATVVDDVSMRIGEVVRGFDLLTSAPRQVALLRKLMAPEPRYIHLPLLVDAQQRKLSKSVGAAAVSRRDPGQTIWWCLSALGQAPPESLRVEGPDVVLTWAVKHWRASSIPRKSTLEVDP